MFVIYHKDTTILFRIPTTRQDQWAREQDAKSALTIRVRQLKQKQEKLWAKAKAEPRFAEVYNRDAVAIYAELGQLSDMRIADKEEFHSKIEKKEIRHGIAGATGQTFEVPVNTPHYLCPSSETYWSM